MKRLLRRIAWFCGGVLLILCGLVGWGYRATQTVPDFYRQALRAVPERQAQASDELVRNVLELNNDLRRSGHWEAVFTAEEINGWLAFDAPRNHPQSLPSEVQDPRLAISPDGIWLACRYGAGRVSTVLSLQVELSLPQPDLVALRIRKARAGSLPLPLNQVVEAIGQGAQRLDLRLRWEQADGDPVALVDLPDLHDGQARRVTIERIELQEGAIFVSGSTHSAGNGEPPRVGQTGDGQNSQIQR